MLNKFKGLNPTVLKLGFVSLLNDIASEMLYPITPIFLTTILGASFTSLGFMEGLAEAIASFTKLYAGGWSDRLRKRKAFVAWGYFLSALSKPMIGFATAWSHVLGAKSVDKFGKGIRTSPRDALIAESVDGKNTGAAFGWHQGMDTLGACLGPLIALWLLSLSKENLRPIFYWAAVPGFFALFLVLTLKEKTEKVIQPKNKIDLTKPIYSKQFKKFLFVWGIFTLVNSSDVFLLLKTKESGLSLTQTILLYCFYNVIYTVGSPTLGRLSDIWGKKKVLIMGLIIFALVYLSFGLVQNPHYYWFLFGIYGVYMGATAGVSKAFASDLIPKDVKATGLGLQGLVTGLTALVASTVAGFLWDHYGTFWPFAFGAAGALIAAVFMFFIKEKGSLHEV